MDITSFMDRPWAIAALGGLVGSIVRWLSLGGTRREAVTMLGVGMLCAAYLHPLAVPILERAFGTIVADRVQLISMSGFFIGVGGEAVTYVLLRVWNRSGANTDKRGDTK